MLRTDTLHKRQTPFLVKYALERSSSDEISGYYSPKAAMWVVCRGGVEVPLIEHARAAVELATKTKTQQESDDEANFFSMAELATKTYSQAEQDDASCDAVLEMATKTEAQLEHDDTSPHVSGIFL